MIFKNSPLQEVVFEVIIDKTKPIKMNDLKFFTKTLEADFPDVETRFILESNVKVKKNKKPITNSRNFQDGFMCLSKDSKKAIYLRPTGFNFISLNPYIGWDHSFAEFKKNWELFSKHFNIKLINRIAVRSVNNILMKDDMNEQAFNFYKNMNIPNLSIKSNSRMSQTCLDILDTDLSNLKSNIIEVLEYNSLNYGLSKILLDIDVYTEKTVRMEHFDLDRDFLSIRTTKNTIFRSYLTPESEEYFK